MRTFITIVILVLAALRVQAQTTISGRIFNEQNTPVEFANVVILAADSSFLYGTISDVDGRFSIAKPQNAEFVNISYIGYETFYKKLSEVVDFQRIVLTSSALELDEVTITATVPKTQLKDGAMVTTVQGSLLAKTGSTTRMLGKIPGLRTTNDGNGIEVFGKGAPEIYINNVKVRDNSELENISPENIKNVEVITSPGARYAANVSAVVRITTVKPVGEGFGFNVKSAFTQSKVVDLDEDLNVNYRKGGLDVFAFGRYSLWNQECYSEVEGLNNSNYKWETFNTLNHNYSADYNPLGGGINYQINDQNYIGAKYTFAFRSKENSNDANILKVMRSGELFDNNSLTTHDKLLKFNDNMLNVYYNGRIGDFSVDFNSDLVLNNHKSESTSRDLSNNFDNRDIITESDVYGKLAAQKLVLGHQLLGGQIDFGAETSFTNRKNDYISHSVQYVPTAINKAIQQNVAGFVEYQYVIKEKYQVKAGLRYEHINYDYYTDGILDEDNSKVYDELFPSASIAGMVGPLQLQLAYTEKIRRPSYGELSNSSYYVSRYLTQTGNPLLKPSINHEAELSAMFAFVMAQVSFRQTKDAIVQYRIVNPENPESEILNQINLDKLPQMGFQIAAQPSFKFYSPMIGFQMMKQWLDIESQNTTIDLEKPFLAVFMRNDFRLKNNWNIELNIACQSSGNWEYGEKTKGYIGVDFYVNKSFFNDALTLEAGINDIFFSQKNNSKLYSQSGYLTEYGEYDTRSFSITLKYRFNPAQSKYKGQGAGNDEKNRM